MVTRNGQLKKTGHQARLRDITCSSYSFNHWDSIYRGQPCSIGSRYVLPEQEQAQL